MNKTEGKIEELIAKHPHLTREEALKIITEKNERKRKKRAASTEKSEAKRSSYEARRAEREKSRGEVTERQEPGHSD